MNSSLTIILISVFVDLLGYGIMLPLLPFFVQAQAGGAAIAGGLMSLYTALRLPEMFGNVMSQSGSVALAFMKQPRLLNQIAEQYTGAPLNIWMDCGMYEHLTDANRTFSELLTETGHRVTYREYAGWHNPICWRDELPHAFETLFPLQGQ